MCGHAEIVKKMKGCGLIAVAVLAYCILVFTLDGRPRCLINERIPHSNPTADELDAGTSFRSSCLECDVVDIRLPLKDEWRFKGTCPIPQNSGTPSEAIVRLIENEERCSNGKCNVWIAYIGDSLLRSPFSHLIDTMLGSDWPSGADRNKWNLSTYHVDQRVCCRKNYGAKPAGLGSHGIDCKFSRAFDTIAFVRRSFRNGDDDRSDVCITWQWNRLADGNLKNLVADYTGIHNHDLQDDAAFAPQMIVVNPGLHAIMSGVAKYEFLNGVRSLLSQMRDTSIIQSQLGLVPTRFVWHDITSVIDADLPKSKRKLLNESMVVDFNAAMQKVLTEELRADDTRRWLRVLPANRLTTLGRKHGLVKALGDGVHYIGGYTRVIAGLHMYFMNATAATSFCRT